MVLGETDSVELDDLPPEILQPAPVSAAVSMAAQSGSRRLCADGSPPIILEGSWEEHEKAKIMEALQRIEWKYHPRRATARHDLPHFAVSIGKIRD